MIQIGVESGEELFQMRNDRQAEIDRLTEELQRIELEEAKEVEQEEADEQEGQARRSDTLQSMHQPIMPHMRVYR